MATHIGIGFSDQIDTSRAAHEAALQAKTRINQPAIDCAIVFSTVHYSALETVNIVRQTLQKPKLVGCSTAGIILSESIAMRGIAVLAITSDELRFGVGCATNITADTMQVAGAELARTALSDFGHHQRQALVFFADGLLENSCRLVQGIQGVFGKIFPVVGAGSSDDFRFKKTHQYFQDAALQNSASAVLFGGNTHIGLAHCHGWKPLGKPRFITHADNHIINRIDNKRASGIYEEYFDMPLSALHSPQQTTTTMLYPLGIRLQKEKEYMLRYAATIGHNGSITCQGDVPQGAEVHVMISNKDFCTQAAVEAAQQVRDSLGGKQPRLVMVFESLARRKLLGRGALPEIRRIRDILGQDTPIIGMYSHGEVAPTRSPDRAGESYLQNATIVIMGIN